MSSEHRSAAGSRSPAHTTVTAASVAVLVAVTALALTAWLLEATGATGSTGTPSDRTPPRAAASPGERVEDGPVDVLRAWDRARAAAWAAGDATALSELYVAGSVAGERDVARLRRWTDRGLRVDGMRMQLLRVDVRTHTEQRLVLRVTDRLTGAVAVRASDGRTWDLPSDRADTRRLVFRRTAGRWRLASSYDKPLARIAVTSGSDIS